MSARASRSSRLLRWRTARRRAQSLLTPVCLLSVSTQHTFMKCGHEMQGTLLGLGDTACLAELHSPCIRGASVSWAGTCFGLQAGVGPSPVAAGIENMSTYSQALSLKFEIDASGPKPFILCCCQCTEKPNAVQPARLPPQGVCSPQPARPSCAGKADGEGANGALAAEDEKMEDAGGADGATEPVDAAGEPAPEAPPAPPAPEPPAPPAVTEAAQEKAGGEADAPGGPADSAVPVGGPPEESEVDATLVILFPYSCKAVLCVVCFDYIKCYFTVAGFAIKVGCVHALTWSKTPCAWPGTCMPCRVAS